MSIDDIKATARERLDYNRETGELVWKVRVSSQAAAGTIAGNLDPDGYRKVGLQGRTYQAHRLVWLVVHGDWPNGVIDHINGIKDDNRIANLRVVTEVENRHSIFRAEKTSRTGARGVSRHGDAFRAKIGVNGKMVWLGRFRTVADAQAAYLAAKEKYHPASAVAKPHFISEGSPLTQGGGNGR